MSDSMNLVFISQFCKHAKFHPLLWMKSVKCKGLKITCSK